MQVLLRRLHPLLPVLAWLGGVFLFFRQFFLSGGDLVTGGPGDGQLITSLHEHWFRFARGLEGWHEMIFFYPAENVLGYSDTFLLTGIPYTAFRFLGLDPFLSLQFVLILLATAGFWGMYRWLHRWRGLSFGTSIFCAFLFLIASPIYLSSRSHLQMLSLWLLPMLLILLEILFVRLRQAKSLTFPFLGIGFLYGSLAYSTFYVAYFFALLMLVALAAGFLLRRHYWDRRLIRGLCQRWKQFLPGLVVFSLFAGLFLYTYFPALQQSGGRPFGIVLQHLPQPWDLINHSTTNLLWGNWAEVLWEYPRQLRHELELGLPPLLFLFVIAGSGTILRVRASTPCKIAAIVFLVSCLLLVRIDTYSLWWLIHKILPGAEGLRAVFRMNLVMILPALLVFAELLDRFAIRMPRKGLFLLFLMGLLIVSEQFHLTPNCRTSRNERFQLVRHIEPAPEGIETFYAFLPSWNPEFPGKRALAHSATVWLAENINLPTINGRSGLFPPGWELFNPLPSSAWPALQQWIEERNITGPVGLYDLDRHRWIRVYRPEPVPPGPFDGLNLLSLPAEQFVELDPVNWSGEEFWGRWTMGREVRLRLPEDRFPEGSYRLELSGRAYAPPGSEPLKVEILLGGSSIGELELQESGKERTVWFPVELEPGERELRFRQNPRSPLSFGGADRRNLGLGVRSLRLIPVP